MAFLQSGGSIVGSAQITDGAIVNADVNAAAAIAQSKIAGAAGSSSDIVRVLTSSNAALSVTTLAGEKVVAWAFGNTAGAVGAALVSINYNSVAKCTAECETGLNQAKSFCVGYTETPGAATNNITVTTSAGSLANYSIIAIILK